MANPLIWQIFLGVAFLAAVVLGIYSVRTWRAWDIVAGFLVFLAGLGFLILAALSLHTRRTWLRQVSSLETRYQQLQQQTQEQLHGDPTEVPQVTPSLTSLRAQLSRLVIDRGRVWRDVVPTGADANGNVNITITADAAAKHQIKDRMVLYAFREANLEGTSVVASDVKVPVAFVGEFHVTGVTDTGITISPSRPMEPDQQAQLTVGGATWSLYEKMPLDSHQVFTQSGSSRTEQEGQPVYGEINEQQVREAFTVVQNNLPEQTRVPAERLEETINNFVRDGKRATATDEPQSVFQKVRFEKEHKVQVDPLAAAAGAAPAEGAPRKFSDYFDPSGLAEAPILQRSDDDFVTIKPGTVVVLPPDTAGALISEGVATLLEPVYIRPLTDFAVALNTFFDRMNRTVQRIQAVRYNTATLQAAKAKVDQMTIYRQQERVKVEQDLEKVTFEVDQLNVLTDAVQQQLNQIRARMVGLYRENLQLVEYLQEAQRIITEQVEQSVADATRR